MLLRGEKSDNRSEKLKGLNPGRSFFLKFFFLINTYQDIKLKIFNTRKH